MPTYHEPAREITVNTEADVIVAGAGPAGICAALAAAREGARVRLIDVHGCLGGVWTAGLLCWIIDAANKPGLIAEIGRELDRRGARRYRTKGGENFAYDPEVMKGLLEEMCLEAGIEIRLHTRVVAAARDSGNRLSVILTESKSGREAWGAKVFVDATGDGDLAFLAGCGFNMGDLKGKVQPMSLAAVVTGPRFEEVEPFIGGSNHEAKHRLLEAIRRGGVEPSYQPPIMVAIHDDLFGLIANHEYNVPCDDARALTEATLRARKEVNAIVHALKRQGGVWENLRLVATGEQIGIREGRRIHGRHTITVDDMIQGTVPEDSVGICTFGIDVHSTDATKSKGFTHGAAKDRTRPYGIPMRALIARDCDGLLLAGRCISGDFYAHSSYRVTGNATATGEAAGICAALAAAGNTLPREVEWARIQRRLEALRSPGALAGK